MSYEANLDAYERFKARNPHVYEKAKEVARFVKQSGKQRYGIGAIFERLRWISDFDTVGEMYKLNNNHRAFMARELSAEPEFIDLFETRIQHR